MSDLNGHSLNPGPVQGVGVGPLPTSVTINQMHIGPQLAVTLQMATPQGISVYFLTADDAKKVAADLIKYASELVVP